MHHQVSYVTLFVTSSNSVFTLLVSFPLVLPVGCLLSWLDNLLPK